MSVKGGEATCEALDGQLAVCYLRQVTVVCSVFFPIHLFQRFHTHIALYAPLGTSDVPQPCTDQHQRRFSIREGSDHSRASANFAVQPLQHVVGSDLQPVLGGECVVGVLSRVMRKYNSVTYEVG